MGEQTVNGMNVEESSSSAVTVKQITCQRNSNNISVISVEIPSVISYPLNK